MNKIIGYILALIGIAGLAISNVSQIKNAIALPSEIAQIGDLNLTIVSVIIAAIGVFLIMRSGRGRGGKRSKNMEVPIYHGKNIVGYRRG